MIMFVVELFTAFAAFGLLLNIIAGVVRLGEGSADLKPFEVLGHVVAFTALQIVGLLAVEAGGAESIQTLLSAGALVVWLHLMYRAAAKSLSSMILLSIGASLLTVCVTFVLSALRVVSVDPAATSLSEHWFFLSLCTLIGLVGFAIHWRQENQAQAYRAIAAE